MCSSNIKNYINIVYTAQNKCNLFNILRTFRLGSDFFLHLNNLTKFDLVWKNYIF